MDFDLFELTKFNSVRGDAYFKGANCKEEFRKLVNDVCKKNNCSKWQLSKELSEFFHTERSTIPKFIYSKDYFPVYLVSKLISFLDIYSQQKYFLFFNDSVEYFKIGASKGWIKFPRKLTSELSWLCGAVAADGWISKETSGNEKLGLIDFYKKALMKASLFFDKCFGYKTLVKKHSKKNCWQIVFRSKPISIFFITYLGFHYGYKADNIIVPKIIEESNFKLDFISGVLTFDGSVSLDGTVGLGCKSRLLTKRISEILNVYGFYVKYSERKNVFYLNSNCLLQSKIADKWINLFGVDVENGQRLKALVYGFKEKVSSEEEILFNLKKFLNYPRKKECPLDNLFLTLKKGGSIKRKELLKLTKLPHVTFYKYVWVLRQANIVSCYTGQFWRGFENTYTFNYDISSWRGPSL